MVARQHVWLSIAAAAILATAAEAQQRSEKTIPDKVQRFIPYKESR